MTETIIRASSLSWYNDCARRSAASIFRVEILAAGYKLRELPQGVGAPVGSALHGGGAYMMKAKAETGTLPPASVTNDVALTILRDYAAPGINYDRETPSLNDAEQTTLRQLAAFRDGCAPDIQPVLIEERLEAAVPGTVENLILSGQPDLICREPNDLDDLKGGKRLGSHGPQVGSYSILARTHGYKIDRVQINFVKRSPMKKEQERPLRVPYPIAVAESAAMGVLKSIDHSISTFRHGDPERHILPGDPWAFGANPQSMLCGSRYCPAHGTDWCHEHAKDMAEEAA